MAAKLGGLAAPSGEHPTTTPPAAADTRIADMKPGMKNLSCTFIALQRGATSKTKDGNTVIQFLVADASGSIQASLWDEKGEALQAGEIFRVTGGYATIYKTSLMLYCSRHGTIERIGEFTMVFSEEPKISELEWVADPRDPSGYAAVQARANTGARLAGPPR